MNGAAALGGVVPPRLAAVAAYAAALAAWAALHLVWQTALAAGAYRLWRVVSPAASPPARFRVALLALAALPTTALLTALATHVALAADARVTAAGAAPAPVVGAPAVLARPVAAIYDAVGGALPWAALLWILGAVLGAGRLWVGWRRLDALRRAARPAPRAVARRVAVLARAAGLSHVPRVLVHPAGGSPMTAEPLVVGRRPAVLLLPDAATCALSPDEWDAVVLHELAHVRRGDYALNWGVRLLEAAGWWHPGVRLLARAAADAREECCDADAVRTSRRPLALARALVRLETLRQAAQSTGDWGGAALAASDGALTARVRRLVHADGLASRSGPGDDPADARTRHVVTTLVAAAAVLGGPLVATTATVSERLPVAAARSGVLPVRRVRIDAVDPGGRFTVRLLNGRVADAALDERAVARDRWDVRGGELVVRGAGGRVLLAVHVDPRGALRWEPRRAARPRRTPGGDAEGPPAR